MVLKDHSDGIKITVALLITAMIFILDINVPLGIAGAVPYVVVITFTSFALNKKYILPSVILVLSLTIFGFFLSPSGGDLGKIISNRVIAVLTILICSYLAYKVKLLFLENKVMAAEIKILQGFLKICSNCKDIKTEDNKWEKLESYISKNSEVKFTHGICPTCAKAVLTDAGIN